MSEKEPVFGSRCHLITGVGTEVEVLINDALPPEQTLKSTGLVATVIVFNSPIWNVLKAVIPFACVDNAFAATRLVGVQVVPSSLRTTKLEVLAPPSTSLATKLNV